MKITSYAVKNYQFTLVIFIMIIVMGLSTILHMPRSEDPETHAPVYTVTVIYPGASPKDMEELIVDPLEKEISELENVKRLRSSIRDGVATIKIDYKYESDVDAKYQEVLRTVNSKRSELPSDILSIDVQKWQPSDVNIMQIALISESAARDKMKLHAEALQDRLEKLTSLKNIKLHGLPEQQVRIELELEKVAQMQIPLDVITASIQSEMANIPGGSVEAGNKTFNLKTSGNYTSLDEISNTIVYSAAGKNVFLKDVAKVYYGYEDEKYIARLNGHRAIFVTAALKDGENISMTQKAYLPIIADFKKTLPPNIDLVHHFDQADNVNKRLGGLGKDFLIAILLVGITLLPLGKRPSILVMISIPLSLSIGIVLLHLFGYILNQLSIVGLVVALGLLVDDSIVVVENIERWMLAGYGRLEATMRATNQIGKAVVGCTAMLLISFFPIAMMPEGAGDFIRGLPMAIMFSVLASMFVSLTIVPFLASRLLKEHTGNPEGNIFMRALKKVIHGTYSRFLDKALNRPKLTLLIATSIFVGAIGVFKIVGFSLFPASEKPQFLINLTMPPQSNLSYTNNIAKQIEGELKAIPEVKYFAGNVGKGNPRVYYNEMAESERSDYAQIFVQLHDETSPDKKIELIEKLRKSWTPYPGAKIEVKNFEQGEGVIAPVEVRVFGENLDSLRAIAMRVEEKLKQVEGTLYVTNPVGLMKTDMRVDINKEKARMLGVPTVTIDKTVRFAVAGLNLGTYNDSNGNEYDILLTRSKVERPTMDAFNNLFVNNMAGSAIPLNQLTDIKLEASPIRINHQEKVRTVSVRAFVQKGYLADNVINAVVEEMDKMGLPAGYTYEMGGETESRQHSFGGFGTIILITAFLFIALLILQFGTFKSTLIVLSVIPLGIVGAAITLWVTGNSLSFVAIIGLIALGGIEVKNTILLVDFTNQLREKGMALEEAIREAGEVRFLPIVLTSLTAIGGLIPIALSTNPLISPLAVVLIGGLISSTLLSRIVTPVVYKLIPPKISPESISLEARLCNG